MGWVLAEKKESSLGIFEKYLTLWVALCIIIGLLLGRFFPVFGQHLDFLKVAQLSIPIGICLFFIMHPTVVGIAFSDVKKAVRKPKPMLLMIIANWVIAPPIMTLHANSRAFGCCISYRDKASDGGSVDAVLSKVWSTDTPPFSKKQETITTEDLRGIN